MLQAALKIRVNPLDALGFPGGVLTLDRAVFLLEMLTPIDESGMSEHELDAAAQRLLDKQDLEDAWEAALDGPYQGPRGQVRPALPQVLPLTPAPRVRFVVLPPLPRRH